MKKLVFINTFIIFILVNTTNAQLSSFTPYGGITLSKKHNPSNIDNSFKSAMIFGISTDYKVNNKFFIKCGLGFEQKGTKYSYTVDVGGGLIINTSNYLTYNYLHLPVLAKFKLGKKENFYFNFGNYAGYLLSGSNRTIVSGEGNDSDQKHPLQLQNIQRFDYGLSIGGGFDVPITTNNNIIFDLRYDFGLITDAKFQTFNLTIGYEFKYNKS